MSIENMFGDLDKIDILAETKAGEVVMVLVCNGFIDGSPETQKALLDKMEGYLNHTQSEEFQKEYGGWPVILRVLLGREPDEHILALLSKCPAWAADYEQVLCPNDTLLLNNSYLLQQFSLRTHEITPFANKKNSMKAMLDQSGDLTLWYTGEEIVVFDFGSNTEVWREAVKCKKSKDPNFAYYCFGMLSPRQSKAAYRVTEGEYALVDLKSAQKVVISNASWHPFFSPDDQCFSVGGKFYLTQTGEEMDNPFPFSVRQGLSFSDTCTVRTRGSLMAVQQDRGSSPIEVWDTGNGQLLATIDDPFVVRQVNFAFTQSGLVLHTDYGAMSIYSCAL